MHDLEQACKHAVICDACIGDLCGGMETTEEEVREETESESETAEGEDVGEGRLGGQ